MTYPKYAITEVIPGGSSPAKSPSADLADVYAQGVNVLIWHLLMTLFNMTDREVMTVYTSFAHKMHEQILTSAYKYTEKLHPDQAAAVIDRVSEESTKVSLLVKSALLDPCFTPLTKRFLRDLFISNLRKESYETPT